MNSDDWVSVDERLPEEETYVLGFFPHEASAPESAPVHTVYWLDGSPRMAWTGESASVSHWMSLPEPPQVGARA